MPYSYNPLIVTKLDRNKKDLNDLEDVNTAGTVGGKVLTYKSGTWIPETPAGGGDMLKAEYVTGAGTVYNASRLGGNTLATVQAHNVAAAKITEGTIDLARVPAIDDAHIPNLETLSYGGTFATAQIPDLPTAKITTGTFGLARIPTMDDAHTPDVDGLSYGGAFAAVQIPDLAASKVTTGTFNVNRIDTLDNLKGTVTAEKVAALPTTKITSGTFGLARIPSITNAYLAGEITSDKISALSGTAIAYPLDADSVGTTAIKASGVGNAELAASGLDIGKFTVGTAGLARIPALPTTRITSGTLAVARHETLDNLNGTVALSQVPTMDDAHIPDLETLSYGGTFATAQIPNLAASKVTSGTFNALRIPILPTDRYGSAVLLTGTQSIGGAKTFTVIPLLPASDPTADNEAARKAYVDAQSGVKFHPYIGDETQLNTVSGTYQDIKNFHFVNHGSVVSPSTVRVACELKTTAGSYQMQIIVGGATAMTFSGTQSTYTLRYSDYGLGAAATGVVESRAKLRNIGAGTAYNRLYDNYLKY